MQQFPFISFQIARRSPKGETGHKDNSFREFRRICAAVAGESSYNAKTEVVRGFFKKGSDGSGFKGDLQVWVRLLLPGVVKRIYNVQSKQLVKIFSRITGASEEDMLEVRSYRHIVLSYGRFVICLHFEIYYALVLAHIRMSTYGSVYFRIWRRATWRRR